MQLRNLLSLSREVPIPGSQAEFEEQERLFDQINLKYLKSIEMSGITCHATLVVQSANRFCSQNSVQITDYSIHCPPPSSLLLRKSALSTGVCTKFCAKFDVYSILKSVSEVQFVQGVWGWLSAITAMGVHSACARRGNPVHSSFYL